MPKTRFTADLPPELFEALTRLVKKEHTTRNALLEEAVKDLLQKRRDITIKEEDEKDG